MLIPANECTEADKGYCGEPQTIDLPDEGTADMILAKKRAHMRHEMCNRQFKNWVCLNSNFRHAISLHHDCMFAIAVLTQLAIENGEPLFDSFFRS